MDTIQNSRKVISILVDNKPNTLAMISSLVVRRNYNIETITASETHMPGVTLITLGKALCIARYSAHRLKPAAAQKAEKTYRAVYALMTPVQRLRLHTHRFLHGVKPE